MDLDLVRLAIGSCSGVMSGLVDVEVLVFGVENAIVLGVEACEGGVFSVFILIALGKSCGAGICGGGGGRTCPLHLHLTLSSNNRLTTITIIAIVVTVAQAWKPIKR